MISQHAGRAPIRSNRKVELAAALAKLETLELEALRLRWRTLTGRDAPATFRITLLRAALAYKLQERVQGGLKTNTRRLLRRVAQAADPALNRTDDLGSRVTGTNVEPDRSLSTGADDSAQTRIVVAALPGGARRRTPAPPLRIKPGTRLLRTWQGRTHEVLVGTDSVSYRGQHYRSLSEVARLITGQRWSGPLFFGLKQRAAPTAGKAHEVAP